MSLMLRNLEALLCNHAVFSFAPGIISSTQQTTIGVFFLFFFPSFLVSFVLV